MADYRCMGVNEVLNASGTLTRLGGSLMDPEVLEAMRQAAGSFVDMNELLQKSGEYLAALLGVGGVLVVNGAAAGMMVAISACIAGRDQARIRSLPDFGNSVEEIIVFKSHRNLYDQALRQTGARLREIGLSDFAFEWDLRSAFNEHTRAVVYYAEFEEAPGSLPLDMVIRIAKEFRVPVIVDAAAELPPVENLWKYYLAGAGLVLFSGGKDLHGPQAAALLIGDRELIETCRLNACPNYSIGRPCKAGKEEIVGMVTAVERYLKQDFAARYRNWESQVATFQTAMAKVEGTNARRVFPGTDYIRPSVIPRVYFELPKTCSLTMDQFEQALLKHNPAVVLAKEKQTFIFNPHVLPLGQEALVAECVVELLTKK